MSTAEERKTWLARQKQGDGGIFPKPEPDRTNRVLNYPGLEYLWEKLKTEGLGTGNTLTDTEVARILGGWDEDELDENWNAKAADKLSTPRTIAIASPSGSVTGSVSFDGTEDVTIEVEHAYMTNEEIQAMLNGLGLIL